MLTYAFIGLVVVCTLVTLMHPRAGMFCVVLIAVLQDPIRKLTPGTSALFTLSVLPIMAAVWLGSSRTSGGAYARFSAVYPALASKLVLLICALLVAFGVVLQFGMAGLMLGLLGGLGYTAPLLTLLAGFILVRGPADILQFMRFYCVVTSLALSGVLLEYWNVAPGWPALGAVSLEMDWIRYQGDYVINLLGGFYRSPDIMGWHAATVVMLALGLAFQRSSRGRWFWLALAAWGIVCVLLGGRRKTIWMPAIWAAVCLLLWLRRQRVPWGKLILVLSALAFGVTELTSYLGMPLNYFNYAGTATTDVRDRIESSSLGGPLETIRQSGYMGLGLGTASQGRQHLGIALPRAWQEDGLSKIMMELGVFGLACSGIFGLSLARASYGAVVKTSGAQQDLAIALLGVMAANAACFIISHPIFSDLVIGNLTAFLIGAVLSIPRWPQAGGGPSAKRQAPSVKPRQWDYRHPYASPNPVLSPPSSALHPAPCAAPSDLRSPICDPPPAVGAQDQKPKPTGR